MAEYGFSPADILIPRQEKTRLEQWSVVACDQYTSEPEYWDRVEQQVGDVPSTLRLVLPEVWLGSEREAERIAQIGQTMRFYLETEVFEQLSGQYLYLERTVSSGQIRRGLIGKIDLEQYDYHAGSQSLVRPTEGTVESRIPPRMRVRSGAPLELPHSMVLVDDPAQTLIEPLARATERMHKRYDFTLMEQGGSIRGWAVDEQSAARIEQALTDLLVAAREQTDRTNPLLFAVGDGNHSLATAKACFEQLKQTLPREQWESHPARYALVELVNVHDPALVFEPIHRVVFGVKPDHLLEELAHSCPPGDVQPFEWCTAEKQGRYLVSNPRSNLAVGTLQLFLDEYVARFGGEVDYIHGDDTVKKLCKRSDAIGFLLPPMRKQELFQTVQLDGALPRKTFSMGHAWEKRYYLEARALE